MTVPELFSIIKRRIWASPTLDEKSKLKVAHLLKQIFKEILDQAAKEEAEYNKKLEEEAAEAMNECDVDGMDLPDFMKDIFRGKK